MIINIQNNHTSFIIIKKYYVLFFKVKQTRFLRIFDNNFFKMEQGSCNNQAKAKKANKQNSVAWRGWKSYFSASDCFICPQGVAAASTSDGGHRKSYSNRLNNHGVFCYSPLIDQRLIIQLFTSYILLIQFYYIFKNGKLCILLVKMNLELDFKPMNVIANEFNAVKHVQLYYRYAVY